jgi:hypothetical protein
MKPQDVFEITMEIAKLYRGSARFRKIYTLCSESDKTTTGYNGFDRNESIRSIMHSTSLDMSMDSGWNEGNSAILASNLDLSNITRSPTPKRPSLVFTKLYTHRKLEAVALYSSTLYVSASEAAFLGPCAL